MTLARRRVCTRALALLGVPALLLAACADGSRKPAPSEPITLSYPYGEPEEYAFENQEIVIAAAAPSYVVLRILADPETAAAAGSELVNRASGTVVDARGWVVTAAHIAVDPRYRALVTTTDGNTYEGQVVDVDRGRELALIEVPNATTLVPARFADSSTLREDDRAVAIGSPRFRAGAVSLGLVREPRLAYPIPYNDFTIPNPIVLDMEIDYGNSGGPVFNDAGELIGMIAGLDLVKPRIAFAVPSNDIVDYVDEIAGRPR